MPRKSTSELKRTGTYRKDRHGKNADQQLVLMDLKKVSVPETITDEYCIEEWNILTNELIKNKLLLRVDLPLLEHAFLALQEMNKIQKLLSTNKNMDDYTKLLTNYKKLFDSYSSVLYKFYITPMQRSQALIKLNENIKTSKSEEDDILKVIKHN